jgi:hypothetical protein
MMTASTTRLAAFLALVFAVGLAVRCHRLDASGFSDDEVYGLRGAEGYARLDFVGNAEHPMMLKLLESVSLEIGETWNGAVRGRPGYTLTAETLLRLPNAVAGAFTGVALFLLARSLFGPAIAAWAAIIWALDVNAASINRIAKEDTLLVLFLVLASWCYERAIALYGDMSKSRRWFGWSGAAFGLMLASKYFPQLLGLHAVFAKAAEPRPGTWRARRFYVAMAAAFVVANFALFTPGNIGYVGGYIRAEMSHRPAASAIGLADDANGHDEARARGLWRREHTGYVYRGRVYNNLAPDTPWGVPWTFYLVAIVAKTPIPVLAALAVGLGLMVRKYRERGFVFARVFLVFTLLGYSLAASKFLRYLLPTLVIVDLLAAAGVVFVIGRLRSLKMNPTIRRMAVAGLAVAVLGGLFQAVVTSAPYPGLYQNALGARLGPPGTIFPNCELYDAGLREATAFVAGAAAQGAVAVSDAPVVVAEYLARSGRTDIDAWSLSSRGIPMQAPETWVLVQGSRLSLENEMTVRQLQSRFAPVREFRVHGVLAVQLFRLTR